MCSEWEEAQHTFRARKLLPINFRSRPTFSQARESLLSCQEKRKKESSSFALRRLVVTLKIYDNLCIFCLLHFIFQIIHGKRRDNDCEKMLQTSAPAFFFLLSPQLVSSSDVWGRVKSKSMGTCFLPSSSLTLAPLDSPNSMWNIKKESKPADEFNAVS